MPESDYAISVPYCTKHEQRHILVSGQKQKDAASHHVQAAYKIVRFPISVSFCV